MRTTWYCWRKRNNRRGQRGLQREFAELHLVVNQEKSRLTTLAEGFAFLGFEFRKAPGRMLLMWPRSKACCNIRQRMREVVRSLPSNGPVDAVIRKLKTRDQVDGSHGF